MFKNSFQKTNKIDDDNMDNITNSHKSNNLKDIGDNLKKVKNNKITKIVVCVLTLILLILSMARIPYIGVFFDSVFFSFIFGYAKYLLYIYFIVLLVQMIINKRVKILFSKRFILSIILSALFLSILFSGIELLNILAQNKDSNGFVNDYLTYWKNYMFSFGPTFIFGKPGYLDGGIIGALVGATSGFFLIIFAILAIIVIYLLLFKSWRNVILQKTKRIKDKFADKKANNNALIIDGNEYVQEQLSFINGNKNEKTKKIELSFGDGSVDYLSSLLTSKKREKNFEKLNMHTNDIDINLIKEKVNVFLRQNNITITDVSINDDNAYFKFSYKISDENKKKLLAVIDDLKMMFKKEEAMIHVSDNIMAIRMSKLKTKIGNYYLKFLRTRIDNPLNYALTLSENYQPIVLDLKKNHNILIYSDNKTNTNNILTNIISSISWNYNRNNIQIFYLSNSMNHMSIFGSPNVANIKISGASNVLKFILKLESYCNDLLLKLKEKKCIDIYHLNNLGSNIKPNRVIIIDEINELIELSPDILSCLKRINDVASVCGITLITIDDSNNFEMFNCLKANVYCMFKSSPEVSKKVLGSNKAAELNSYNDAILYNKLTKNIINITTCNYNDAEINEIVKILVSTYKEFYI